MADLTRLKRRRSALKNVIMKSLFGKAEPLLQMKQEDISETDMKKLEDIFMNLKVITENYALPLPPPPPPHYLKNRLGFLQETYPSYRSISFNWFPIKKIT